MNILHVIPGDLWAGAESQVYYTVKGLSIFPQHKIRVIVFNQGELYQKLLDAGVDVLLLDEFHLGNWAIYKRLKQLLIDYDVQIVHVHEYKSHILTVLAKLLSGKKKCILFRTFHGHYKPSRFKSYLIHGCQNFFLRYLTDHVIAVSNELKIHFLEKKTKAVVHLIHNGFEPDMLVSNAAELEVRKSFGIPEDQFWIGAAARLEAVKNLPLLIEAGCYIKKRYRKLNFRISIFGEGSLRENLQRQIMQNDLSEHVFLEGHKTNIIPVLQSLDVFSLTSFHEGLPMSLLEAMSVGTIPVCTSVGGMKEVITHGVDGFLVPLHDEKELAETFIYIYKLGKTSQNISDKAREKIKKEFSVVRNCERLMSLYEKNE